jgi:tetratricopeptide (TPR) repeat protein
MARIFAGSNRIPQAIQIYETAVKNNLDQKGVKADLIDLHYDWGMLLLKTGNEQQGIEHLQLSANICLELLLDDPNSGKIHARLGTFSAILGDFAKAVVHFKKAVDLEPDNTENHFYLIRALETQGLLDESIERANASIRFFNDIGRKDEAAKMLEYLRHLEQKKPGEK